MREVTSEASTDDEISLVAIANVLLRKRRTIAAMVLIGAAVGLIVGMLGTRKYASTATFVPQMANDQSGASGLALAASQFGIRVANGGSAWPAAIYVELLSSRGLLEPLAVDTLVVAEKGNQRVAVMDLFEVRDAAPARRVEKTVRALRAIVSATEVKKLGAVQLTLSTKWPSVSLALTQRLIDGVSRFNTKTRQSQATAERQFVEGQAREAEHALRIAEDRMQAFLQRNRIVGSPELTFERDRLQREITLRQQAYTSLLQSHEEARIREVRDTPVITVLEAPVLAAIGESRQAALKAAMGAILGVFAALVVIAASEGRASSSHAAQAFFQTLDDATPRFLSRRSET